MCLFSSLNIQSYMKWLQIITPYSLWLITTDWVKQICQEWQENSSIDKDHHLPYLETKPPLIEPKRTWTSEADISLHILIMILLASYPFTLYLCSSTSPKAPQPNPCAIKSLDSLLLRKEIRTLLPSGSPSVNGKGNFLDHKRKEGFQFNFFKLETQMIG